MRSISEKGNPLLTSSISFAGVVAVPSDFISFQHIHTYTRMIEHISASPSVNTKLIERISQTDTRSCCEWLDRNCLYKFAQTTEQ
jgi:hypothetical protein